ncbi:hypothetical protein F5X99DRAFT_381160 [Biscogniauxia marginata]|nr:hypothetical protein F5X99DRAFT_381160 [Biscogniauxia marginata]
MDSLPQELVDHIVSFLPKKIWEFSSPGKTPRLPGYSILSRRFQKAIESRTFETLAIRSDNHELRQFVAIQNPLRRTYLRHFYYCIDLPPCKSALFQRFKDPAEQEANNQAFTIAIWQLFRILQTKDHTKDISLFIYDIVSPTDQKLRSSLGYRRYERSRIRLLMEPEKLQLLPKVSRLAFAPTTHPVLPRICIDIATRLPDLKTLDMNIDAQELLYPGLPRQDRHTLAEAITEHSGQLKKLVNVFIAFGPLGGPCNQFLSMPDLLYPLQHDPLGVALRRWSGNIEYLDLKGTFDGTLFWPHSSESAEDHRESPVRAKLKKIYVSLEKHTPSGWWYFMPENANDYGMPARNLLFM